MKRGNRETWFPQRNYWMRPVRHAGNEAGRLLSYYAVQFAGTVNERDEKVHHFSMRVTERTLC